MSNSLFLAEGHIQSTRFALVNLAFGQEPSVRHLIAYIQVVDHSAAPYFLSPTLTRRGRGDKKLRSPGVAPCYGAMAYGQASLAQLDDLIEGQIKLI